ncbi:MAG TPA: methyltransferase domain-containing protein [Ktedonobacterales bacterium]|nr:methyltransferase domain-containing protein [Ktedonobacterales bacterium]
MPKRFWWQRSDNAPMPMDIPGRETVQAGQSHYLLPNDLGESHRLDFQHYALHAYFDTNHFAPLDQPDSILDAACGTGRWPVEMAREFPQARVIGIDIHTPEQHYLEALGTLPPNYTFQLGNILESLPFADGTFAYVHMRFMVTAMPAVQWSLVVGELARVTAPGGRVELVEGDLPVEGGPALEQLREWLMQLVALRGVDGTLGSQIGSFLADAGLADVVARNTLLPMGPQGGKVGQLVATDMFSAFRGLTQPLEQSDIASPDVIQQTLAAAHEEVYGGHYQCKWPIFTAYGSKIQ